ncbi:MAG: bifunctional metallophosphatase/5'-nucleotidase [Schwartzia sp.]|nr:bifunctional metallophosphatase/5'-nucleotidase [Schwartzia sp. (in: firmicutes)]
MKKRFRQRISFVLALLFTLAFTATALAADVVILHTNDIHCGIEKNINIASLAAYKKELKKQGVPVLLVDAGDAVQGEPIGKMSQGMSLVRIMNAVGFDFIIPGNHEFDYGMPRFFELLKSQHTPYYSCNFTDLRTNTLPLKPYKIFEKGGHRIAFVGVTTPETLNSSTPKYFKDEQGNFIYGFNEDASGQKLYRAIQKAVDAAKAEGAEAVFLVGHLGMDGSIPRWSSIAIAENTTGIKAIIDGHSHEQYEARIRRNLKGEEVLITQTGTKLETVGKLVLHDDGTLSSTLDTVLPDPDPKVLKVIAKENKRFEPVLKQPVGEALVDLRDGDPATGVRRVRNGETNMGDFVADAYRAVLNCDVAIVNGGSLRNNIKKGVFTYQDLLTSFPFGNMCAVVEVTGQQLADALELGAKNYPEENGAFMQVSGLTYTLDARIPSSIELDERGNFVAVRGERRVRDIMVNGQPLDLNRLYTVGGTTYILKDGGNGMVMFKGARLLQDGALSDVDAIMEFVQNHKNAKITDEYGDWQGQGRINIIQ